MKRAIVFVLLALLPALGHAEVNTSVQSLRSSCVALDTPNRSGFLATECLGYFQGYGEAIEYYREIMTDRPFCPPSGYTVGQMVAVFVAWANKNPDKWHLPRARGVQMSLTEAFPCTNT